MSRAFSFTLVEPRPAITAAGLRLFCRIGVVAEAFVEGIAELGPEQGESY